ncbi:MAG: hypothetical protein DRI37_06890 [Chloroflexi bacterium]|nr:MAG: hypothetical protein DRI37_06890 [Chloroflexota bacterium]
MRLNESKEIMKHFNELGFKNIKLIKAEEFYLKELKGVVDPEQKRILIGKLFVDIANEEISNLSKNGELLLVQGTIYPDTIESGSTDKAALIKTHHNRVSEIEKLISKGKIIEPLKELYKDEVRKLGKELGLPHKLIYRHPFPGPGLAIRIICSDKTDTQDDYKKEENSMNDILEKFQMVGKILPIKSVGVQGDFRTYHYPAVVWFKNNKYRSWEKINECSSMVINKLKTVNRLIFSLSPVGNLKLETLYLEKQNLAELRKIDAMLRSRTDEIGEIWQMPVVQLPLCNSGKKLCYVMRPVCSQDAMSASIFEMNFDLLKEITSGIQELGNTIFYDITTKPPGTIEWE